MRSWVGKRRERQKIHLIRSAYYPSFLPMKHNHLVRKVSFAVKCGQAEKVKTGCLVNFCHSQCRLLFAKGPADFNSFSFDIRFIGGL